MLILINKDWFDLCCWHICISIFPAVQLIFKWDIILLVPIETNWQNKKKNTQRSIFVPAELFWFTTPSRHLESLSGHKSPRLQLIPSFKYFHRI
jgi:hypothetical protein